MREPVKYYVLADRFGKIFVAGSDFERDATDVQLSGPFESGDHAFDAAEALQARVDVALRGHCATC